MFKKFVYTLSFLALLPLASQAADWNAPIKQIISCSDNWFEVELVDKTMYHAPTGKTNLIRFMVRANVIGAEKYKQIYAMSLTAFSTNSNVWIGTGQANTTTSISGGNCNTNNVPAQEGLGMAIYR